MLASKSAVGAIPELANSLAIGSSGKIGESTLAPVTLVSSLASTL
jgi:hypothetical protein